jgi:hypothetical protein
MAGSLTQILSGAGLAGASGHRAFLPPLLLGIAHRFAAATTAAGDQPFFELSQKFQWLADPKVIAVLAVLTIVEYVAEKNPDAPELVNLALKLPKAASGFLVAAAATGRVDENLALLGTSGVVGAGIALGVDKLRADVKHAIQQPLSDATHGHSDKAMGSLETAWAGFLSVCAWLLPILALVALGVVVGVWFARRKIEDAGRVPCPKCGKRVMKDARVCPGCKADLVASPAAAPPADRPVGGS